MPGSKRPESKYVFITFVFGGVMRTTEPGWRDEISSCVPVGWLGTVEHATGGEARWEVVGLEVVHICSFQLRNYLAAEKCVKGFWSLPKLFDISLYH